MFSLRSSLRLCGKSTQRMFHKRPGQKTSGQLLRKASEYFDRPRLDLDLMTLGSTVYATTLVYAWSELNRLEKINDERVEEERKYLEELDRLKKMSKEMDKKCKELQKK